jgi:hypothetical protein
MRQVGPVSKDRADCDFGGPHREFKKNRAAPAGGRRPGRFSPCFLWTSRPCAPSGGTGMKGARMSHMENLSTHPDSRAVGDSTYDRAVASIEAQKRRREARGYALMSAVDGYGTGANGRGTFGKISHAAKLFCIGFAFLVPSLLVWHVLL